MSAPVLSHGEWLTWCMWVNDASAAQIAYSLGVGESTVRKYIARIRDKTGVTGKIAMSRLDLEHRPWQARRGSSTPATLGTSPAGLDTSPGNVGQSVPSG